MPPKSRYELGLEKKAERFDIRVKHCAVTTTVVVLGIAGITLLVFGLGGFWDKVGGPLYAYKLQTYHGDDSFSDSLTKEAQDSGRFPEDVNSDWSYGWSCQGQGPMYTYRNKLQFKRDFPNYIDESEEVLKKELEKVGKYNMSLKIKYLEEGFYNACIKYSKDIFKYTNEWICCQVTGSDIPVYTMQRGSKRQFQGNTKASAFHTKSIVVPPLGDTSSHQYNKDQYDFGDTSENEKWNNGFKCSLDSKNAQNKAIKHGYHVTASDTSAKEPGNLTAKECSTWCKNQNMRKANSVEGANVKALGQGWSFVYPSCCLWAPAQRDCYYAKSADQQNNISAEWDGTSTSIFYPFPSWQ